MTDRETKTIIIVASREYDADFPPTNLQECASWFADQLAKVPVEYRSTARVEFEVVDDYESSRYVTITVAYRRPETDEEEADRLLKQRKLSKYEEEKRELLAKLKAKYEGAR